MQPQSLPAVFFNMLCGFVIFLVLLTCCPKLSILSKVTPSTLTTGICELLIVRCGSNLASLAHVVITVLLDFSADSCQSS